MSARNLHTWESNCLVTVADEKHKCLQLDILVSLYCFATVKVLVTVFVHQIIFFFLVVSLILLTFTQDTYSTVSSCVQSYKRIEKTVPKKPSTLNFRLGRTEKRCTKRGINIVAYSTFVLDKGDRP